MKSQTMDPAKLKVVELRAELSKRGLETKGNKAVLIERLREALDGEAGNEPNEQVGSSPESENEREKSPEPPKPAETTTRPSRRGRNQDQSQEQPSTPVARTPSRGATRASARAVTPDKKPPVKSPVAEKANELPTVVESTEEEAAAQKSSPEEQKEAPPSTKKTQRKQEEPPSDAPESAVEIKDTVKSQGSPVKQETHVSPAKPAQEPPASPVKPVQAAQQSPVKPAQSSPVKPTQAAQQSPAKPAPASQQSPAKPAPASQQSPAKPASASQQSPAKPAPGSQQSPAKPAPANQQSPAKPAPTIQQSPAKPAPAIQQSPAKSAPTVQQSPAKSAPTVQQSPAKSAPPIQQSPAKPAPAIQQSPAKPTPGIQHSPAKPAPASQQSPAKPVPASQQSPAKLAPASQKSPATPNQGTQQSPVKPAQEVNISPVKPPVASPAKPVQEFRATPVKSQASPLKSSQEINQSPTKLPQDQTKTPEKPLECPKDDDKDEEDLGYYAHLITSEEDMKEDDAKPLDEEEMDSSDKYEHEVDFKEDEKRQDEDLQTQGDGIKDVEMVEAKPDRKRKRSLSPEEEVIKPSTRPEDEPELDEAAVALSWYDSDLNLVIKKEDFFSATPMYSDGFGYVWAGARATYGFKTGKVFYEVKISENCPITLQDEENPYVLRAGWSAVGTSMQLGEEPFSYGFDGTGKKSTNNEFSDYGETFSKDDIVGCYLDLSSDNVEISYTINGNNLGPAFTISKEELGDRALFPHILTKNSTFVCNFGQEEPWRSSTLEGYTFVAKVDLNDRVLGPQRPVKRDDCEILMLCGLPGAGKTTWAIKYAAEHPEKMYNILGTNTLIEKMKVMGLPRKTNHQGKWEVVIDKCSRAMTKLLDMAARRRRNYILDQNNVYPTAQKRKMRHFTGFQKKAIVIITSDEEFQVRSSKPEYPETKCPENSIQEMKANFTAPVVGDSFTAVEYVELPEEEAKSLIEKYNKEAKEAGFGQQQEKKRSRFEKADHHRDGRNSRDGRDSRDSRDSRRSGYQDRNRNPAWRGGGGSGSSGGGWRDRNQRGGGHRYSGSPSTWRGRGGPSGTAAHRGGSDRRGSDRRSSNDRNRPSRPGGWGQTGYQGSQAAGSWGGQGSWSGAQAGWNQGGWGGGQQQWGGNWKGYGQGSYGQSGYNQQNYGNGKPSGDHNSTYHKRY
ncbi:heterogeneous nuclear ribonucleoprotein U-like protein 2 isoform X2 [Belonocnema kinseyi]|uniref:heterogeneous nuclear ribonucleoprotein U-like protein 2 isoform X2 n=1 Tax=Belonocnema kinseyi TaxID=2817044 RepID=UPI00143DE358|nr:heterogeneous nuclear ribonucleoprotein U-like protein 2 isoform X2 [Belonocnema kinseyi]